MKEKGGTSPWIPLYVLFLDGRDAGAACLEEEWRCHSSGECISLDVLCDTIQASRRGVALSLIRGVHQPRRTL
jgi:hypothetical protein